MIREINFKLVNSNLCKLIVNYSRIEIPAGDCQKNPRQMISSPVAGQDQAACHSKIHFKSELQILGTFLEVINHRVIKVMPKITKIRSDMQYYHRQSRNARHLQAANCSLKMQRMIT